MRLAILLVLAFCVGHVTAEEAEGAASKLASSQNADGSWGGTDKGVESRIYITAKVLEGLVRSGEKSGAVDRGVGWIELQDPKDTAGLSEVIMVFYLSGRSPGSRLSTLEEYQNVGGGWGKTAGFKSTPWYTSAAVIALSPFGDYLDTGVMGGEYLLSEQGADGDFEDSAMVTSNCIYALVLLYNATKREDFAVGAIRGYEWLNKTAGKDGAWDSAVSTGNSVIALDALYRLVGSEDMRTLTDTAKRWIIDSPGNKSDHLSTALGLLALKGETAVSPAKPRASISAVLTKEHVFPSEDTDIRFKLENRGITNMKNVSLSLVTPKDLRAKIGKTKWRIDNLQRNASVEFTETVFLAADVNEGEYPLTISWGPVNSTVRLSVLKFPLLFEVSPTELKNGAPLNFDLLIKNQGRKDVFIKGIALDMDESWRDVELKRVQLDLLPGSVKSVALFSATTPDKSGEYSGAITIDFVHPDLGGRQITLDQKFLVSGAIPSGILKLVLYGTLILSVILLLNLLTGYDLLG